MRHDWIFDVLLDLRTYALAHGMATLAQKAEEALLAARDEVAREDERLAPRASPMRGSNSQ